MSVYEMPARMAALLQNAQGIANFGVFPVGQGVPQEVSQSIINNVGSSIGGLLDFSAPFSQAAANSMGLNAGLGSPLAGGVNPLLGGGAGLGALGGLGGAAGGLGAAAGGAQQNPMVLLNQMVQALSMLLGQRR